MSVSTDHARAGIGYINDLLDPVPMRLETGISRLDTGALVVAVRTELPGCKGRMLDWWFKHFDTTEHLSWWHPLDHVAHNGWDAHRIRGKRYVGATIRAVESLGDIPPVPAVIKFHEPGEVFGQVVFEQALAAGHASAAVYARIGFGETARLDDSGDPLDGQMVHVVRDTDQGAVLRSRFILGLDAGASHPVPDAIGLGLLQHCYTEFGYLAKVLPSLYWADPANRADVPVLW
ncbi:Phloretin hydrolase [Ensifer sp. M14]|uniref:DAPG hydrolase family protein n=1 Tax=Ensifer sp. M14 TaxID=2203782 RepID=UPI000E1DBF67|nr:hydrolase [Ensifer sp. M14]RDL48995.1 Phloretin hydrolase [Ensifer sp. M14]